MDRRYIYQYKLTLSLSLSMALAMFLSFLLIAMSSADLLQNPDFESPPTNVTSNFTTPYLLLTKANTIPGWSFNGTVRYVTSGPNISLPGNGHGVQLGQGGKISQAFKANKDYMYYVLTFTLAPGNKKCSNKSVVVNVSTPETSKLFSLERNFGKKMWESHAYYLGGWDDGTKRINLVIQSASPDMHPNDLCAPIVDTFVIKRIGMPRLYTGDHLTNGAFEVGPAFIKDSTEGVLLYEETDSWQSPLQSWSVKGTVKYIDSKHYPVPKGKAAIELLSGEISGISTIAGLSEGSTYKLGFLMGDANDSCSGEFIVYVQVGMTVRNFTIQRDSTGSAQNYSMTFKANLTQTLISFESSEQRQTNDHVFCGPVIDHISLSAVNGVRPKQKHTVLLSCLFFIIAVVHLVG